MSSPYFSFTIPLIPSPPIRQMSRNVMLFLLFIRMCWLGFSYVSLRQSLIILYFDVIFGNNERFFRSLIVGLFEKIRHKFYYDYSATSSGTVPVAKERCRSQSPISDEDREKTD